jgi:hypothetical protein
MIENSCNEGRFTDRPFFVFNRGWYVMMGDVWNRPHVPGWVKSSGNQRTKTHEPVIITESGHKNSGHTFRPGSFTDTALIMEVRRGLRLPPSSFTWVAPTDGFTSLVAA